MTLRRVLIANRGAILNRILDTLDRLGVESVAVYSDADRFTAPVRRATTAERVGPGPAAESYLDIDAVLAAAARSGADAVHPGYGFLSEHAGFAEAVEAAGLAFVGPRPEHLRAFGAKHRARELAVAAGVAMLPGTGVLASADEAIEAAEAIGWPVMLKASGGGGGIGLRVCHDHDQLIESFDSITRLSRANFGSDQVFLEKYLARARHVEVQVFGDGDGRAAVLGDRDCSAQRRNQKVIEEAPAPALAEATRADMHAQSVDLMASVAYRSAGTVEFVVDADTGEHYFLEVNTRLQVEHGVTELVTGIDLVEWMVRLAGGDTGVLDDRPDPGPGGHAVQARIYAEHPTRDFAPSPGVLAHVRWPGDVRVDTWVTPGTEVSVFYDPMLAKVLAHGADRDEARARLAAALEATELSGIATNVEYVGAVVRSPAFDAGAMTTTTLAGLDVTPAAAEILDPGGRSMVVAWPGRLGLWAVGVPPSGPFDDRSHRLANAALGNPDDAAALECAVHGPTLRFHREAVVLVAGASATVTVDDVEEPMWEPITVPAGATVRVGPIGSPGARCYLAVAGGFDVPEVLGSRTTFDLGRFGGLGGRALQPGDLLPLGGACGAGYAPVPVDDRPEIVSDWTLRVLPGPHGSPDYLTPADIEMLHSTAWEVHYNSARTGVRLVGPRPTWARGDGGEAGLHPSNIHDNAYAVGTVDFTGDMPVLLGPDGPSLGGFVCPATVIGVDLWKLGQLSAGDTVRLERVDVRPAASSTRSATSDPYVLGRTEGTPGRPPLTFRRSGERHLLVEIGEPVLDLDLRVRAHQLEQVFADVAGVVDLTPGIRSLQVHVDGHDLSLERAIDVVRHADADLPPVDGVVLPSREVRLPLSWDDPEVRKAIEIYQRVVRDDAPWVAAADRSDGTLSNLEFIRRVNGLDSIDDVRRIAFDAEYLVYGLGDVYLGAPVATPLDPRHRLVTTKYNPARTWTPENAVGIGGAYLCIYGMEGPGGYQFIGRTVPVWQRWPAPGEPPWLLRFFDRLRFYPVEPDELLDLRAAAAAGAWRPETVDGELSIADHHAFLASIADDAGRARDRQQRAFAAERDRWEASGELSAWDQADAAPPTGPTDLDVPPGATVVESPLTGRVWTVAADPDARVAAGDPLVVLEAMKTETTVAAPCDGRILSVACQPGQVVSTGDPLVVLDPG